jgi:predicted ester cyclase
VTEDNRRDRATEAPAIPPGVSRGSAAQARSRRLPRVEQRAGKGDYALARKGAIDDILTGPGERGQPLRGFEPVYTDIVDYIVRCTHRIWEEGGIGLIYTHYAANSVVHAGNGVTYGREQVIVNTIQAQAAVPDRKLYADDVIWSGDEDAGFHTSHHLMEIGHNTGYSAYGPPTGRRVAYRAIANCFVRENVILEEWLLGDDLLLIRQLGYDPHAIARKRALARLREGSSFQPAGPLQRGLGQRMPDAAAPGLSARSDGAFDPEDFVRQAFHEIWNWRLLNRVRDYYAPNHRCRTASGRRFQGTDNLIAFNLSLLAALPDARMTVDHIYWNGNDDEGYRVAVRWTLEGTHDGPGEWGEPSGARVSMMGLSHLRIEDGRFVEESTLFDELGMLEQIWLARLGTARIAAPED